MMTIGGVRTHRLPEMEALETEERGVCCVLRVSTVTCGKVETRSATVKLKLIADSRSFLAELTGKVRLGLRSAILTKSAIL